MEWVKPFHLFYLNQSRKMAKIRTSALIADIKGKVGGNIFASNKGGNYVKSYKKPTNKNSSSQQKSRMFFGNISQYWRRITEEQRQSWRSGAPNFPYIDKLGQTKILSGYQLFIKLNKATFQAIDNILLKCPIPQSFPYYKTLYAYQNFVIRAVGYVFENYWTLNVPTNFIFQVWATPITSDGITKPNKNEFRLLKQVPSGLNFGQVNVGEEYIAKFGQPLNNENCFIGYTWLNTLSGEQSELVFMRTIFD